MTCVLSFTSYAAVKSQTLPSYECITQSNTEVLLPIKKWFITFVLYWFNNKGGSGEG